MRIVLMTILCLLLGLLVPIVPVNAREVKSVTAASTLKMELVFESPSKEQKQSAESGGREAVSSIGVKITNTSTENQLLCEQPVLSTLTWNINHKDGKKIENKNRGFDVDYDYSPHLTEGKCHIIKPKESMVLPHEKVCLEKLKDDYYLSVSYTELYGPMKKGIFTINVTAANAAAAPRFDDEHELVKSLKLKHKTAKPINLTLTQDLTIPVRL